MKGSKEQTFWLGFGVVMVVLIGASGYYMFTSLQDYNQRKKNFVQLRNKHIALESREIYPNETNVLKLTKDIDSFEQHVDVLHEKLKKFQKPFKQVEDTAFSKALRDRVNRFEDYALSEKRVPLPESFYFGMDAYATAIPFPAATGILEYQLDAIEYLLRIAIDEGAKEVIALQRDPVALERKDGKDPELTEKVAKYPIMVSFLTSHNGFREFVNQVSNDKEYFYIIRVLRVDNTKKVGPSKVSDKPIIVKDKDGNKVIVEPGDEFDYNSEDYVKEDASVVFGDELIKITAVIDICRFPEQPDSSPQPAPDSKLSKR